MSGVPKPISKGQRIGCMEAVTGREVSNLPTEWRCVNCGAVRVTRFYTLIRNIRQHGPGSGCCECHSKTRKEKTERNRRTAGKEQMDRLRVGRAGRQNKATAGNCHHKKRLICVDPGNVEIWRCPKCDVTGLSRWTPPRAGNLFPGRGLNKDEQSPSFDNAVRILEGD